MKQSSKTSENDESIQEGDLPFQRLDKYSHVSRERLFSPVTYLPKATTHHSLVFGESCSNIKATRKVKWVNLSKKKLIFLLASL